MLLIAVQFLYNTPHMDFIALIITKTHEAKSFASARITLLLERADGSIKIDFV